MKEKKVLRIFFNKYAPKYMDEIFTKNTLKEVDFLEEELKLVKGSSILDVGCGTLRHSNMLKEAKKAGDSLGVNVNFVCADATDF